MIPRAWSRKSCPRETVEKASRLTKEPRMESSVASSEQGLGAIPSQAGEVEGSHRLRHRGGAP